ncbi:FesM [Roseiconus nitratireducens]|uniref:FesM n=1 Tax=Roseiconus nitratireducens TaxID=2605748 RepID=A0A5M6DB62_9BACT|nr:FesM [Roseiconus nitratireducens]
MRLPLLGRFLRWRYSRMLLQSCVLLLSLVMIGHAFWGPQLAPKNLAALLTWVHFRGLVVIVILLAGNLFCMACPFMLPREIARRIHAPRWDWPQKLRNKWPAIILFAMVLFAYELFDLFSDPWWTGALIVAYFALAAITDVLFRRASFCKYVCPVGQFNFVCSTMSPLEVAVRDRDVCGNCATKDCIRGVHQEATSSKDAFTKGALPLVQRGCELDLFQPRKRGNLDCTFCLDCVYACPHDNVGILTRLPAEELAYEGTRSGIGTPERRFDFTALTIVFAFGALLNAFAMISPVYAAERWIADVTGLRTEWPILAAIFALALVIEPALLLGAAASLTRFFSRSDTPLLSIINRYIRSLIPIGFGVWLAHYGFHFFTGLLTVIPVAQNAAKSTGTAWLGQPQWQLGGLPETVVYPLELGFMSLGLIGSWMIAWSIASQRSSNRIALRFAPWAALHLLLYVSAVWIMNQPMDMRGTFLGG